MHIFMYVILFNNISLLTNIRCWWPFSRSKNGCFLITGVCKLPTCHKINFFSELPINLLLAFEFWIKLKIGGYQMRVVDNIFKDEAGKKTKFVQVKPVSFSLVLLITYNITMLFHLIWSCLSLISLLRMKVSRSF